MTSEVEKATAVLADLESKLANTSARAVELQVERKRLAFDANTGNAKARKALDAANSASGAIGLEIENITSAIDEARRRLAHARRAEAAAAGRENALAVIALAAEAGERGRVVGQLLTELSRELRRTFEDARSLSRLGVPAINQRSLILALTRTFLATFRDAGLDVDLIPPGQRHPPEELVRNNTDRAVKWAESFLAKEAA
jgi:hypothetical protein